jgi:pimeloyl-ACP methyl ester carboxylesterase
MPTIELSAGVLEYDDTGEGPTVVLLHGLLMNQTLWDEVVPMLPAGFRYVRPVLPLGGHRLAMRRRWRGRCAPS